MRLPNEYTGVTIKAAQLKYLRWCSDLVWLLFGEFHSFPFSFESFFSLGIYYELERSIQA